MYQFSTKMISTQRCLSQRGHTVTVKSRLSGNAQQQLLNFKKLTETQMMGNSEDDNTTKVSVSLVMHYVLLGVVLHSWRQNVHSITLTALDSWITHKCFLQWITSLQNTMLCSQWKSEQLSVCIQKFSKGQAEFTSQGWYCTLGAVWNSKQL